MNTMNKYRIHEVAKDFGLKSKDIITILESYATPPKGHTQALTNEELNIVFDIVSVRGEVADMEAYFKAAEAAAAEARASASAETAERAAEPASPKPKAASGAPRAESPKAAQSVKPEAAAAARQPAPTSEDARPRKADLPAKERVAKPKREVRVIDTRAASADLSRYDDRVDKLVPDKAHMMDARKEKIKQKADQQRRVAQSAKRRQEEADKIRRLQMQAKKPVQIRVQIPEEISVSVLASRMKKSGAEVVKQLMKLGVMASMSDVIDFDTASLAAMEMGAKVEKEVVVTIEERLIDVSEDRTEDLTPRSPVVVVMGHVDHGKTSLLDKIRNANVTAGEAGGITQHIGAYSVSINGRDITFLDTPGHAAFTSMRMRGANVTDIAILVVGADDGIMPQTVEAINHAKAANVPIIVAVNKMDKPEANPERVMQQLTEYNLIPEEWGGETVVCKVSAKTGDGLDNLLEMILLTADVQELRANPARKAQGAVIEARLDKGRGPVATLLVQNGTLRQGDIIIAGTSVGRVRAMDDHRGERLEEAGPSTPVEIIGLAEVPSAGDSFHAVEDERMARELAEQRKDDIKIAESRPSQKVTLDDLFAQIKEGEVKDLNVIVKADVQGSAEALKMSLEKLSNDEVRVQVLHTGVGAVSENDVLLASTANAIVVGFNVRPEASAAENAKRAGVDVRMYRIIYECLDEIEAAMKGMLAPKYKEEELGRAEIRQVFRATNIGTVAGSYVQEGKIVRGSTLRVVRDGIVMHEGSMAALKRFKDDVREVAAGYECGISLEGYTDIREGDVLECFRMVEIDK